MAVLPVTEVVLLVFLLPVPLPAQEQLSYQVGRLTILEQWKNSVDKKICY